MEEVSLRPNVLWCDILIVSPEGRAVKRFVADGDESELNIMKGRKPPRNNNEIKARSNDCT